MSKVVQLKDFGDELRATSDAQIKALRFATVNAVAKAIPKLVELSPVDTGLYAASWNFTEEEGKVILGNYAPHAPHIEYGVREGHMPPLEPLLAWAKRVLNDASQPPHYSEEVQALARGTQMKIYRQGQKPKNIMTNMIPVIIEDIKKEYAKETERLSKMKVAGKAAKIGLKG